MSLTKKIALGLGIASGALLAAWLLTGDRKKKTREFVARQTESLKRALRNRKKETATDEDPIYI